LQVAVCVLLYHLDLALCLLVEVDYDLCHHHYAEKVYHEIVGVSPKKELAVIVLVSHAVIFLMIDFAVYFVKLEEYHEIVGVSLKKELALIVLVSHVVIFLMIELAVYLVKLEDYHEIVAIFLMIAVVVLIVGTEEAHGRAAIFRMKDPAVVVQVEGSEDSRSAFCLRENFADDQLAAGRQRD
jgi:hypothetical protein